MDYIAANYHIPWTSEDVIDGAQITNPDPAEWNRFKKDSVRSAPDSEYHTFNRVYYGDVTETNKGQTLAVLEAIAQSDDGVRAWLNDILDYAYCRNCGHIYDSAVAGDCSNCQEDAELKVAREEYSDIINDCIEEFGERLVRFAYEYHEDLTSEQSTLEERRSELSEILADAKQSTGFGDFSSNDNDEETEKAKRDLETVRGEIRTVDQPSRGLQRHESRKGTRTVGPFRVHTTVACVRRQRSRDPVSPQPKNRKNQRTTRVKLGP
jgi:hypothetical protein